MIRAVPATPIIRVISSFRRLAQLVARLLWEQDVASSSLASPTKHGGRRLHLPVKLVVD